MQYGDLPNVLKNERRSYSHPWTEGIFVDCLNSGYECWLFVLEGRNVGHSILSIAAGESHLLNVCIHPDFQGHGFGRALVEHMLYRARSGGARTVYLEVRTSNKVAYSLYEGLGFNEVGVRRDYYPAFVGREDALVLAKEILPVD
ncbi:MAG: ribosomal protein S18-alanine N-acetyltransferase [Pseudomonadales bacterium]|nr:ribosomal protein S18-alanine N-acetyltransferase [Pseudomonadales bacterium]